MPKKGKQEELPGMERRDVPEIEQAAENYRKIRDERCDLSKRESEAKSALITVMRNLGRSFYNYAGLRVQLETTDNVKVRASDEDDEEPIGKFTQRSNHPKINTSPATEFIEEIDAEEEAQREAGEKCVCGHVRDWHDGQGGCCMGCGPGECEGFRSGEEENEQQAEISDDERERVHAEAVARWQRHAPAPVVSEAPDQIEIALDPSKCICGHEANDHDIDEVDRGALVPSNCMITDCDCKDFTEDAGGTPFPTEYSQDEINRMEGFYCADKIADSKPVKICYVNDQPHVITGALSSKSGKNWQSVDAWPILPLENVGEENAKTYSEAQTDYYAGDITDPDRAFTYEGIKINCGSKAKPKWWVMVGSGKTFTIKQEKADDFTADRCDECGRIDGAHKPECSKSSALRFDDYLAYARAHYKSNHQSHARKMELSKLKDKEVREWKQQQAGKAVEPETKPKKSKKLTAVEAAIDR